MNNGVFDLKRKIAFAAALLVVSHSMGTMPAVAASSAVKVQSNDRKINAQEEGTGSADDREDGAATTSAVTTLVTTTSAATANTTVTAATTITATTASATATTTATTTANTARSYTINIVGGGGKLEYRDFNFLAKNVLKIEKVELGSNSDYNNTITVDDDVVPDCKDFDDPDNKVRFKYISTEGNTINYEVYYEVNINENVKNVSIDYVSVKGESEAFPEDNYCQYGSVIKFIPDEYYALNKKDEAVPFSVRSAMNIYASDVNENESDLHINGDTLHISPRAFSFELSDHYSIFKKSWNRTVGNDSEINWKDVDDYYIKCPGKKAIVITLNGKSELFYINNERFELRELIENDALKFKAGKFTLTGVETEYHVRYYYDHQKVKEPTVSVQKEGDKYYISVPYIEDNKYRLVNYKYNTPDLEPVEPKEENTSGFAYKIEVEAIDDLGKNREIMLDYYSIDRDEDASYSTGKDVSVRNDKCYNINKLFPANRKAELIKLDEALIGSDIYSSWFEKTLEQNAIAIRSENNPWSVDVSDKTFIYVHNILKNDADNNLKRALDTGICFYNDKEAPNVNVDNYEVTSGNNGTEFEIAVDDNATCNVKREGNLLYEQALICDIYDNYINVPSEDKKEIKSVIIGDYRFDRPAKGWGSAEEYTGRIELQSERDKEEALEKLIAALNDTEISKSAYVKSLETYDDCVDFISKGGLSKVSSYYESLRAEQLELNGAVSAALIKESDNFTKAKEEYEAAVEKAETEKAAYAKSEKKMKVVPTLIFDKEKQTFKVKISVPKEYQNKAFNEDIKVFAVDECGNIGKGQGKVDTVKVKIDGISPVIKDEENKKILVGNYKVAYASEREGIREYVLLGADALISAFVTDMNSSIKEVTGSFGGNQFEMVYSGNDDRYEYRVKEDDLQTELKEYVIINAKDICDNFASISSEFIKEKFVVIVDKTAPESSIIENSDVDNFFPETKIEDGKERIIKWFKDFDDVRLDITAADLNTDICSGIKELNIYINEEHEKKLELWNYGINEDDLKVKGNYYIAFENSNEADRLNVFLKNSKDEEFSVTLFENIQYNKTEYDGNRVDNIKVGIQATDFAQQSGERIFETVYVDLKPPQIDSIKVDDDDLIRNGDFGYKVFRSSETAVSIRVTDPAPSSGIKEVNVSFCDENGNIIEGMERNAVRSDEPDLWNVTVPANFKGSLKIKAVDNVRREVSADTYGIITENSDKHYETSDLRIQLPNTEYRDINGRPLYNRVLNNNDIKLYAADTFSGIKSISANVTAKGRLLISDDYDPNESDAHGWEKTGNSTEYNLVKELERTINVGEDSNDITIELGMKDNAGNPADDRKESANFSIDVTDPKIDVKFTEADGSPERESKSLYNTARRAEITITECNFDPSLAEVYVNGSRRELNFNSVNEQGTKESRYQAVLPFEADGVYELNIKCRDLAGRTAQEYDQRFEIDRTAPHLNVGYNKNITNSHYYNEPVVATFSISDANFDPQSINISGSYNHKSEDFPKPSEWVRNGNEYTSTVRFEKNGEYEVNISGRDKAGNTLDTYNNKFCIDTQKPSIVTGNVQKSNNGVEIRPRIQFSDINIDKNSIKIELNGADRGKSLEYSGELIETKDGYEYIFDNFPQAIEYDDIYTIKASAKDNANNKIEKELLFSVNRFGSTFILDEATAHIVGKFISEPRDIIITERNPDKHANANSVFITKDSEMINLKEGRDYSIEEHGGNGEWSEYKYVIFAKNFDEDAKYSVSIHSEDEAGNINVSAALKKNASVSFSVDKTKPLCIPINISENSTYKGESYIAKISVSDNVALKDVKVYIDGQPVQTNVENDEYSFEIYNSNHAQEVSVVLTDMADNEVEYKYKNILVTTSVLRLLIRKTWVKVTGGATLLLAGASAFFVRRKRKYR